MKATLHTLQHFTLLLLLTQKKSHKKLQNVLSIPLDSTKGQVACAPRGLHKRTAKFFEKHSEKTAPTGKEEAKTIAEDDAIIEAFDSLSRQNDLAVEHYNYESSAEQFRASPGNSLFALTFWLAARDRAIHSRINCLRCFNLSAKVIDAIASTTPLQVFCACVNSQTSALRNFKLMCPMDDCVCVIDAATETEKAGLIVTPQLCLARPSSCAKSLALCLAPSRNVP